MMLVCQIVQSDVKFRIVDTKPGPMKQSRAIALHARIVETYAQLSFEEVVKSRSELINGVKMYANGTLPMTVHLSRVGNDITP